MSQILTEPIREFSVKNLKGHNIILGIILLIPVLGIIIGTLVSQSYEKQYESVIIQAIKEKQDVDLSSNQQFINKIKLGVICKNTNLDPAFSELCGQYAQINILTYMSIATLIFATLAFAFIFGIGNFSQQNRDLLFYLFRPGLFIVQICSAILVAANAGILVFSIYFAESFYLGRVHFGLIGILGIIAAIAAISVFIKSFIPIKGTETKVFGKILPKTDYPKIWEFTEELANKIGTTVPNTIIAGMEPSFFVTESKVLCLDGQVNGKTLFISLPFCRAISKNEFTAIVGHEMGHFVGEDTKWSKKFYPIYRGSIETISLLEQSSSSQDNGLIQLAFLPAQFFMSIFITGFEKSEKAISRQRELSADRVGAKITSEKNMASALVKAHVYQHVWNITLEEMKKALSTGQQIINLSKFFSAVCSIVSYANMKNEIGSSHTSHPTDTHPSLSVRLKAMGIELDDVCTDELRIDEADQTIMLIDNVETLEEELSEIEHYKMVQLGQVQPPDQR